MEADEMLRFKMMVRNKIEGRYDEKKTSKKQFIKLKQSESKKNLMQAPKHGSA